MRIDYFATELIIILLQAITSECILWDRVRCSSDAEQDVLEGKVSDIGRFPWLGIVQHSFYLGEKVRFAVTGGVLIHPGYAIAPAEDVAKIQPEQLLNNTKFIVWHSDTIKYALDVSDYLLHPEYLEKVTFATIALLQLFTVGETGAGANSAPVLPICLPFRGSGVYSDLYAVKMTDEANEIQKEVIKMNYVESKDCEEFYYRAKLTYKKMMPTSGLCAVSERQKESCVWDGGVALISRQSWGFWKLLGFGVRGPGCGAPARFLNIHDYLSWINEIISRKPYEDSEEDEEVQKWALRHLSPVKLVMYKTEKFRTKETGQCNRKTRGHVLYKDSTEVLVNKNFAQGFFFVVVTNIAQFTCMVVNIESLARTNAVMWVEHSCKRELTGLGAGVTMPPQKGNDRMPFTQLECFLYFKSAAFIEFRFFFSFKAFVEVTLYGHVEIPRRIPNPWVTYITTEPWWPTARIIKWGYWAPYYHWWYSL